LWIRNDFFRFRRPSEIGGNKCTSKDYSKSYNLQCFYLREFVVNGEFEV
jgi:hypothetical protein